MLHRVKQPSFRAHMQIQTFRPVFLFKHDAVLTQFCSVSAVLKRNQQFDFADRLRQRVADGLQQVVEAFLLQR